jgi:hypothetical protein
MHMHGTNKYDLQLVKSGINIHDISFCVRNLKVFHLR